jgi:hypothetical protein
MTASPYESPHKHLCFAMFHINEADSIVHKIGDRKIELRDVAVLFAMMSCCDYKTGKVKFVAKTLAKRLNITATNFSASVKRLKQEFLVALVLEQNGDKYYVINPYLFSVGRRQKWGHLVSLFSEAIN